MRVYVVEAHHLAKKHLRLILSKDASFRITEIESQNLKTLPRPGPDVFVLSHFHGSSLPNYLRLVQHLSRSIKVLLVGPPFRSAIMLSLLRSGVHAFVWDEDVDADLAMATRSLVEGRVWIRSKYLMPGKDSNRPYDSDALEASGPLTPQQRRVAGLVCERLSNKEIAAELGISERTVKFHLQNAFLSLGVSNRHEICDVLVPARSPSTV